MNKEKILDRIRKLFAMGDSSRNPNEGEVKTALAMAQKLMTEHNLTLSEIDLEKQKEDITKEFTEEVSLFRYWERTLANLIAKLFNCDNIMNPTSYRKTTWMFVGFKDEAKMASESYNYLNKIIRVMAIQEAEDKYAYYEGVVTRLKERVAEEIKNRTPEQESKCTAIVCCKNTLIKKFEEKNLHLKTTRHRKPASRDFSADYLKGYMAGNNLDLNNKPKLEE